MKTENFSYALKAWMSIMNVQTTADQAIRAYMTLQDSTNQDAVEHHATK